MRCKYPQCQNLSTRTWALVNLCRHHYEQIEAETHQYYTEKNNKKMEFGPRRHYMKIAHLIPWSKFNREWVIE